MGERYRKGWPRDAGHRDERAGMIQTTTAPGMTHPTQGHEPKYKGIAAIPPPHVATRRVCGRPERVATGLQVDPKYLISLELKVFSVA